MKQQNIERQPIMRLANAWRAWTAEVCGGTKRPFTPKEWGQFKCLRRTLGNWTTLVMHWAINNWDGFATEAKSAAGLGSAPPQPHIGFLLCHYHIAQHLMIKAANNMPDHDFFRTTVLEMRDEFQRKLQEELTAWAELEESVQDTASASWAPPE